MTLNLFAHEHQGARLRRVGEIDDVWSVNCACVPAATLDDPCATARDLGHHNPVTLIYGSFWVKTPAQRRFDLTDFEWAIIEPLLPNKPRAPVDCR
jgi:hypothetical protein